MEVNLEPYLIQMKFYLTQMKSRPDKVLYDPYMQEIKFLPKLFIRPGVNFRSVADLGPISNLYLVYV